MASKNRKLIPNIFTLIFDQNLKRMKVKPKAAKETPKTKVCAPKRERIVKEINNYVLNHCPGVSPDEVPSTSKCLSSTLPDKLICINKSTAGKIASAILENISSGTLKDMPILDISPGLGLLSKKLLDLGANKLRLYESRPKINAMLQTLAKNHKTKVQVFQQDLYNLGKTLFLDKIPGSTLMDDAMQGIEFKQPPEISFTVVGVCSNYSFLHLMPHTICYDLGFPHYGATEYFLVVHPYNYLKLTSVPGGNYLHYRYHTVAYQIFFNTQVVAKLERKNFLPWEKSWELNAKKSLNQKKLYCFDEDFLYLLHITPKSTIYELSSSEKQQLLYFLKFNLMSRRGKIIPALEKWISNCETRLHKLGIGKNTCCGEISPDKFLALFQEFISWPEFSHCAFNTSMHMSFLKSNLQRIELSPMEEESLEEEEEEQYQ
ncbi:dimethyladenosine transferase 2, mitochondrial [Neocloeon triangulifer]|uniref:dimethyladenosine transferase 2, mitochondrial n=1 Tax=Neocloeon triangulifer TaxID=2078957 RepID=UPI00286FA0E7|nr:dimethyladenosine transferase 2, mitochondrial [Neocloeon triangulifer]XP_059481130.1 dimethyladenosine transferase 2, mitochondrial [Neocloeon triangulifer]XP_059481131.1 dimethyladenosine transferase 2, mitochondrial [Neocloeon triangulifer]